MQLSFGFPTGGRNGKGQGLQIHNLERVDMADVKEEAHPAGRGDPAPLTPLSIRPILGSLG